MASAKIATITCEITNDDKEFQASFHVQLLREGSLLFERQHWGLQEWWKFGTSQETSSSDLSPREIPARGNYMLRVVIDEGEIGVAVNAKWSISIITTDGDRLVSDPFTDMMQNQVREFETQFVL